LKKANTSAGGSTLSFLPAPKNVNVELPEPSIPTNVKTDKQLPQYIEPPLVSPSSPPQTAVETKKKEPEDEVTIKLKKLQNEQKIQEQKQRSSQTQKVF
jgi:hypothetical protein